MSHDLILGQTSRDWSCGKLVVTPVPERPWDLLPEAGKQAEAVRSEMSKTATTVIKMRRAGLLPDADWRGFGKLHRQWLNLSDSRRGRWQESDSLLLWNLREACKTFAQRFAALGNLSKPVGTALVPTSPPPTPPPSPPGSGPWYVALGAALALAGIGIYSNVRGK
jgi:hypothetical protein